MFAGPNSYSLQCMMEGNDMHVNTLISLCSSFNMLRTNSDFISIQTNRPAAAMTGTNVHVHTA